MTTTFEKWKGAERPNYCTLPTIDVEIVTPAPACATCDREIKEHPTERNWAGPLWVHADTGEREHYIKHRPTCRYCGTNDKGVVVDRQHAWHDARECSRCGGVSGYAIGD